MSDYTSTMASQGTDMPEAEQKQAGKPLAGDIDQEHKNFLKTLFDLLDRKEIDPDEPKTFLKRDVYDNLDEQWQDKVDLSLVNLADQIRQIQTVRSEGEGSDSIHLQTMVEHVWEMKQRIEKHVDAFIF